MTRKWWDFRQKRVTRRHSRVLQGNHDVSPKDSLSDRICRCANDHDSSECEVNQTVQLKASRANDTMSELPYRNKMGEPSPSWRW